MHAATQALLRQYYAMFNARDIHGLLDLLSDDVIHDIGQERREFGKTAFARFMEQISSFCQEHIFDIEIMTDGDGTRAAAEFTILGSYQTEALGCQTGPGQTFRAPGGAFFQIQGGKITRISNYCRLQEWLAAQLPADAPIGETPSPPTRLHTVD